MPPSDGDRFARASDALLEVGGGNVLQAAVRASADPTAPFLTVERPLRDLDGTPRRSFTVADLDELTEAWACWYAARGIARRDRVALYLENSFAYLLHVYALTQLGAIPVVINGALDADVAVTLLARTRPSALMADEERLARLEPLLDAPALRWTQVAEAVTPPRARLDDRQRHRHADDDPILICHSSGTTATPKPVIWAHRQSVEGYRSRLEAPPRRRERVLLSALPQSHAAAFGFTALTLLSSSRLVVAAATDGESVARAVEAEQPQEVVAFAGTYAELVDHVDRGFDSVEVWIGIGDASHGAHVERLVQAGSHRTGDGRAAGSIFVDGFGSSELGWGVFSNAFVPGAERYDRCLGLPQPIAEAAVLREDGTEAAAYEVGRLGVRSPTVTPGYWDDSDATYRSKLAGYWVSDDFVYRDVNGRYFHIDRTADAIPTADGHAYSVLMEETLLAQLDDVDECAVVGREHDGRLEPVAIVAPAPGREVDPDALLARANDALARQRQPALRSVEIALAADDIPLGVTRKVLKRRLRGRVEVAPGRRDERRVEGAGTDES